MANSCNANACAPQGMENAMRMCQAAAKLLKVDPADMIVASTGVIGQRLNIEAIEAGLPEAYSQLRRDGSDDAAHAIMTTDTVKKEYAFEAVIGRQDRPPGRHLQRLRHDPPEYGDDALLPDNGLRHFPRNAAPGPA